MCDVVALRGVMWWEVCVGRFSASSRPLSKSRKGELGDPDSQGSRKIRSSERGDAM
jgi:hypothetical protein